MRARRSRLWRPFVLWGALDTLPFVSDILVHWSSYIHKHVLRYHTYMHTYNTCLQLSSTLHYQTDRNICLQQCSALIIHTPHLIAQTHHQNTWNMYSTTSQDRATQDRNSTLRVNVLSFTARTILPLHASQLQGEGDECSFIPCAATILCSKVSTT